MSLIQCPECKNQISTSAVSCPHCGYVLKNVTVPKYEQQVVNIRCWGRGEGAVNKGLMPYIQQGWEVVSMEEDYWRGGWLSPVYKVVMKRKK